MDGFTILVIAVMMLGLLVWGYQKFISGNYVNPTSGEINRQREILREQDEELNRSHDESIRQMEEHNNHHKW